MLDEIWMWEIFQYVPMIDLFHIESVSKRFQQLIRRSISSRNDVNEYFEYLHYCQQIARDKNYLIGYKINISIDRLRFIWKYVDKTDPLISFIYIDSWCCCKNFFATCASG